MSYFASYSVLKEERRTDFQGFHNLCEEAFISHAPLNSIHLLYLMGAPFYLLQ